MGTILQWTCRGLMKNQPELCILSQQYNPVAICLQEIHISDDDKATFKALLLTINLLCRIRQTGQKLDAPEYHSGGVKMKSNETVWLANSFTQSLFYTCI